MIIPSMMPGPMLPLQRCSTNVSLGTSCQLAKDDTIAEPKKQWLSWHAASGHATNGTQEENGWKLLDQPSTMGFSMVRGAFEQILRRLNEGLQSLITLQDSNKQRDPVMSSPV